MKNFIAFILFVYSVSALRLTKEFVDTKWDTFKKTFSRDYVAEEESFRKEIFRKNLEHFEEHNEMYRKGLVSYTLGVNAFSDKTEEEKSQYFGKLIVPAEMPEPAKKIKSAEDLGIAKGVLYPQSLDWRDHGVVTRVRNQGSCGSCWAFAAIGAIESQAALVNRKIIDTSPQQLVDCVQEASGCGGGWMTDAFGYVADNGGIDSESAYPYEGKDGRCRYKPDGVVAKVSYYGCLSTPDERLLAQLVSTQGPVAIAFDASGDFGSYSGGVYYNPACDPYRFTHAVLLVGYGHENGRDYWLLKNSWGEQWGDRGYFKLARNADNHCGIANMVSYPIL